MFSSRQGSSFRGKKKKIIKPRITFSNITGLDSTNADCWVFYMGRLLEGARLCLFFLTLPVICPFAYFRILSTASASFRILQE